MSEMERNKGKLVLVSDDLKQFAEEIVNDFPKYYDTKEEYLRVDGEHLGYIVLNDKVYKVEWEIQHGSDYDGFADVTENEDGSIDFHTFHYNGAAHWTEVLEDAMKENDNVAV